MAINEERSYTEYNVEVPTTDFPIGFDILDDGIDVVAVTLNDVDPTTLGYTVIQVNNTTYRFAPAVPSGVVRLTRTTDIDQMAHVFTEGAIFISENMDGNFKQIRHAQQEVRDNFAKLRVDTDSILVDLNEVRDEAQDATQAANDAAFTANEAAAAVNDKVSYSDLDNAVDIAVSPIKDYVALPYKPFKSYKLYERVQLENGDIVKSTVADNVIDPNVDMTGWLFAADSVNLKMFDGDPSGATPSDGAFIKMAAYSKSTNTPIRNNSGTYLLSGSDEIIVGFDADFSGSVFKLAADFSGKIVVGDNATQVKYEVGNSNFDQLKTAAQALKGESSIDILKSNNFLDDQYVKFSSSQQMFRYRGDIQTRKEFNKVLKRGQLRHTFLYDFDFSLLTSVLAQKRIGAWEVKGLTIDESALIGDRILDVIIARNTNNLKLKGTSFVNNAAVIPLKLSLRRVNVSNIYDSEIDGMGVPSTTYDENQNAYTLIHGDTLNLKVKNVNADGDGWGAFGGGDNRAITYEDCKVSRIDCHTPFQEYLRSINCDIGNLGYNICGMGDLIITGGSVTLRKQADSGRETMSYFVRSRPDSGGFIDGDLIVDGTKLTGYFQHTSKVFNLLTVQPFTVGQSEPVVGSPINYRFFNNININMISDVNNLATAYLIYSYQDSNTMFLKSPTKIEISGNLNISTLNIELNRFIKNTYISININDLAVDFIQFLHNSSYTSQKILFNGNGLTPLGVATGVSSTGVKFRNVCDGVFNISKSRVYDYTESIAAQNNTYTPNVTFSDNFFDLTLGGSVFISRSSATTAQQKPAQMFLSNNRIKTLDGNGVGYTSLRNMLVKLKCLGNSVDDNLCVARPFSVANDTTNTTSFDVTSAETKLLLNIKSGLSSATKFDSIVVPIGYANTVDFQNGTAVVSISSGVSTVTINKSILKTIEIVDIY